MQVFKTDEWKLVVRPMFVQINKKEKLEHCVHCSGKGSINTDWYTETCKWCWGVGLQNRPIPPGPPPEITPEFAEYLQKCIDNYPNGSE